jgi:hypothetical protein
MWIYFRNKNMFWNCIMKLKWTNSNVTTSPIFDGFFHVIKSLIILIASFVRGCIMMLKLHEWSQEIWSKNVIFKCKNYVPHLLFHEFMIYLLSFMLCFSFCFCFLKICIIIQWYVHSVFWQKMTFSAFHYLTRSAVRN